jgi:hypothetical protein
VVDLLVYGVVKIKNENENENKNDTTVVGRSQCSPIGVGKLSQGTRLYCAYLGLTHLYPFHTSWCLLDSLNQ